MFTELFDTQKSLKYSSSIFIVNIFFNNALLQYSTFVADLF